LRQSAWQAGNRSAGTARWAVPDGAISSRLALAGFEAALGLVDHVDPAFAADKAIVAVPTTQRFQ
jgi:hypothetical protein